MSMGQLTLVIMSNLIFEDSKAVFNLKSAKTGFRSYFQYYRS